MLLRGLHSDYGKRPWVRDGRVPLNWKKKKRDAKNLSGRKKSRGKAHREVGKKSRKAYGPSFRMTPRIPLRVVDAGGGTGREELDTKNRDIRRGTQIGGQGSTSANDLMKGTSITILCYQSRRSYRKNQRKKKKNWRKNRNCTPAASGAHETAERFFRKLTWKEKTAIGM